MRALVLDGVAFPFYSVSAQGVRRTVVRIDAAGEPARDHYREDGSALVGWGEVVGRYPGGAPASVQGSVGEGWMLLTGIHPEAPENWRGGLRFATSTSDSHAYAAKLVDAALNRTRLDHF